MCHDSQYRKTKYIKSHWEEKKSKKEGEAELHEPSKSLAKTVIYYNNEQYY